MTEDKFKPGLTSYYYRIQYQMYDITHLLSAGKNVWAVILGDGWWRGNSGGNVQNNFGLKLQFFGQIVLTYGNGEQEWIVTDEDFKTSTGALRVSDMFMGDEVDERLEEDWKEASFDDSHWERVTKVKDAYGAELIASRSVPVREKERFTPDLLRDASGRLVLDFGQNIAGYVHMKLRDTREGQKIHLVHGEDIDGNGNFSQKNIRQIGAREMPRFQEVYYTCKGSGMEEYTPMFSIFGFRYVLLEGYEEENIRPGDFVAVAVYSDLEETGDFTCSNPLINQLVKNSRWSQKGNFMDVAVDCPTRERNAWTGDNQIYVKTATDFMNVYPFYEKWLQDQAIEQYESGKVGITFPSTSSVHLQESLEELKKANPMAALAGPSGNGSIGEDCAGWGDAAAYLPYIIYLSYGDPQILKNQYQTAKKWVDYMLRCAGEHNPLYEDQPQYHTLGEDGRPDGEYIYDTRMHYGEWQEPIEKEAQGEGKTLAEIFMDMVKKGKPQVATAYMCRSARNVAQMARALGKEEEAREYERTAKRISTVYETWLIGENGVIEPGHQAAYVRALSMNLCTGEKRKAVEKQLVREVENNHYRLNTGFLSTPFLLPVLCDMGRADLAFRLLEQTEAPGWLHPVLLGATTIPEDWYSFDRHEASYNHYSFGAVCDFLFSYVAGIRPLWETPGYQRFALQPLAGGSLTKAAAVYESLYGTIRSSWEKEKGGYCYRCTIPPNTTAVLRFMDGSERTLGSGAYTFHVPTEMMEQISAHEAEKAE